jgi:protein SCO1/2
MLRFYKILTLIIVIFLLGVVLVTRPWNSGDSASSPPPVYGQLEGTYTFHDQNDQDFHTATMTGQVWLVNFFFTSCQGPCPLLSAEIAGILAKETSVHALSITTDPETDTQLVLQNYAKKFRADPARWVFASADHAEMVSFGQTVLKLPVGETPDAHSPRIVLIDKQGKIRGWYDSQEPKVRDNILRDIRAM